MAIWLTSDLHIGHTFIAKLRGFDSVEDHDDTIIRNINKQVGPRDDLYILGDLVMGGWRQNLPKLRLVNGNKHVVLGNHDRPAPNNKNGHMHLAEFIRLGDFRSVSTMASLGYEGHRIMLSHYAYDSAPGDADNVDDFIEYRLRDHGVPIAHGHSHSLERFSRSRAGTPQVHVGLDAWSLKPVLLRDAVNLTKD